MRAVSLVLISMACFSLGVSQASAKPVTNAGDETSAPKPKKVVVVNLRGPEAAGPPGQPAAQAQPPLSPLPTPPPAITESALDSPVPTDPEECRSNCARNYYFCLGGDDQACSNEWVSCRAGCEPDQRLP